MSNCRVWGILHLELAAARDQAALDPRATASGSIDPLGVLRPFTAVATTLLPVVTTITSRVRYLSWGCCQVNRFGA